MSNLAINTFTTFSGEEGLEINCIQWELLSSIAVETRPPEKLVMKRLHRILFSSPDTNLAA